jgi:peptidoglycan/LPS O-acetylase OafA/YrhL
MKRTVFAMLLGGLLGIFDGLTALVSAPELAPEIAGIVIGSTFKGVLTGLAVGLFARKVRSLALGVLFGLAVALTLAYLVTLGNPPQYFWKIMLPGGAVGLIVGYAASTYRDRTAVRDPQSV